MPDCIWPRARMNSKSEQDGMSLSCANGGSSVMHIFDIHSLPNCNDACICFNMLLAFGATVV